MQDKEWGKVIQFPKRHDAVNAPEHYCDGGIETIDFIRAKLGELGFYYYCMGNIMKYTSRAGKKGDTLQDLQKAQVYLGWAEESIARLRAMEQANQE